MSKPVDNILNQWKSYLTNISSNLMELSDQTEFKSIKSKTVDKANGYTGITKIKADKCVESVGVLWQQYALLSEVIEKAVSLNSRQSILYDPEEDIRKLLEETLIVIDKKHVDINERNLLQDETNEKMATPKFLLKHMQETFEGICRDITEVSRAEETLQSRLGNIKTEIRRLNSAVGRLGITDIPAFETDRVTEVERDPLQGMIELDKLVYSIEKYRASIKTLEDYYNQIIGSFDRVRAMLFELRELAVKSAEAVNRSKEIFKDTVPVKPVIGEEILKSLEDWLSVLKNKLAAGALNAVKVGVSRLEGECSQKLKIEKENYEVNCKAYNEWMDLKGQFRAMLAKADALRTRGMLMDNSLNESIEKANAALHADPVDLDNCRQYINKFKLSL